MHSLGVVGVAVAVGSRSFVAGRLLLRVALDDGLRNTATEVG
jgi:hypothetical protein